MTRQSESRSNKHQTEVSSCFIPFPSVQGKGIWALQRIHPNGTGQKKYMTKINHHCHSKHTYSRMDVTNSRCIRLPMSPLPFFNLRSILNDCKVTGWPSVDKAGRVILWSDLAGDRSWLTFNSFCIPTMAAIMTGIYKTSECGTCSSLTLCNAHRACVSNSGRFEAAKPG